MLTWLIADLTGKHTRLPEKLSVHECAGDLVGPPQAELTAQALAQEP